MVSVSGKYLYIWSSDSFSVAPLLSCRVLHLHLHDRRYSSYYQLEENSMAVEHTEGKPMGKLIAHDRMPHAFCYECRMRQ